MPASMAQRTRNGEQSREVLPRAAVPLGLHRPATSPHAEMMTSPGGRRVHHPQRPCFASDFVRQERQKIPSHQTACNTSLEADHDVGSERELRYSQALIEVPAAAGAV